MNNEYSFLKKGILYSNIYCNNITKYSLFGGEYLDTLTPSDFIRRMQVSVCALMISYNIKKMGKALFDKEIIDEFYEYIVSVIATKQDDKYIFDKDIYNDKKTVLSILRNKLQHGKINIIDDNLILYYNTGTEAESTILLPIDKLVEFTKLLYSKIFREKFSEYNVIISLISDPINIDSFEKFKESIKNIYIEYIHEEEQSIPRDELDIMQRRIQLTNGLYNKKPMGKVNYKYLIDCDEEDLKKLYYFCKTYGSEYNSLELRNLLGSGIQELFNPNVETLRVNQSFLNTLNFLNYENSEKNDFITCLEDLATTAVLMLMYNTLNIGVDTIIGNCNTHFSELVEGQKFDYSLLDLSLLEKDTYGEYFMKQDIKFERFDSEYKEYIKNNPQNKRAADAIYARKEKYIKNYNILYYLRCALAHGDYTYPFEAFKETTDDTSKVYFKHYFNGELRYKNKIDRDDLYQTFCQSNMKPLIDFINGKIEEPTKIKQDTPLQRVKKLKERVQDIMHR